MPGTSGIYRIGQDSQLILDAMILARLMNIDVDWQYLVFTHNVHQIDDARKIAKENGINLLLMKSDRTGGGVEVPAEWKPKKNKEIVYDSI
jgi:hypothetical protein